jgi:long-chain acyl-CoA synthetase
VTHDDVILAPLPLSYHFVASALSCVQAGATILDCADLIAPEMLAFGATFGATMIYASPIQYELMARTDSSHPLTKLKRAISTSALLPKRTADSFFERFRVRLTQVYGIIEVGLPLWNELESIESTALGICKPPYEAIVVDEHGQRLPAGEIGELAIRGPGLFSGYLLENLSDSPEEGTAQSLDGRWFFTGDLVTKDELGVILYRGRKKSVINCGGNKIFPEEIEEVLRRSPDITAVRVSAEPHPLLGSLVIAEVVPVQTSTPSVEAWRALCYNELSGYKVPKEFRIVDSLPSTGSGKILRYKNRTTADTI